MKVYDYDGQVVFELSREELSRLPLLEGPDMGPDEAMLPEAEWNTAGFALAREIESMLDPSRAPYSWPDLRSLVQEAWRTIAEEEEYWQSDTDPEEVEWAETLAYFLLRAKGLVA